MQKRLLFVLKRIEQANDCSNTPAENLNDDVKNDTDDGELDQFIEFEFSKKALKTPRRPITDEQLLQKIKRLGLQNKIKIGSNIFGYYQLLKDHRQIDNNLFNAVMVVLSAPATQVTVERAFSALALVLNNHRCNLHTSTVNDILSICLNRDLIGFIKFDEMR